MYAVIFKASMKRLDEQYQQTASRMRQLATEEYGCREFVSVSQGSQEISISYWDSLEAIQKWKNNAEHKHAQTQGKEHWYRDYSVEIVSIERHYHSK